MILFWLIAVPLLGGGLAWWAEGRFGKGSRGVALGAWAVEALLFLSLLPQASNQKDWMLQLVWAWIPRFGIGFHLGLDGLSLLLIGLTVLLGFMALGCSWTEIAERKGLYYLNLLWTLAGVVGVFLALDLFLFFVCWEAMLVPMYFLIALWGHENRAYAAMKFFIFTQVGGLSMLVAIVALAFLHRQSDGMVSFDYLRLLGASLEPVAARWILLGFFIAFAVKLPAVPFHTWLPDAHTQAPTGGSVLLAGVLLKTGGYGLLRFALPLFPGAAREFAPIAMALGAVSIVYAAKLAFAQSDFKRMVAYTSVSHMGFVLLGGFALNPWGYQGAVMTMLAHGLSAAALFMLAGGLQQRLHTRDLGAMGGFWTHAPRMGGMGLFFAVAALGMPGLGNFIGEFLVLLGGFRASVPLAALAVFGLVLAPVYALKIVQQVFHGPPAAQLPADYSLREWGLMLALAVATLWLGLYPQTLLDLSNPARDEFTQTLAGLKP